MDEPMRVFIVSLLALCCCSSLQAHHPDREAQPVVQQPFDLIGPLGNRLPMSYRRRYNRPTNLGGKIAYYIAPTSQEAMRWHKATHQGQYQCDAPRMVAQYFYPKPWESLRMGPRPGPQSKVDQDSQQSMSYESADWQADQAREAGEAAESNINLDHFELEDADLGLPTNE